jgi:hypothetical protein
MYLRTLPKEQRRFAGVRRLPGQPPTPQELYVDDRVERAEGFLYPPKGKKCFKCHMLEDINEKKWGDPDASIIDISQNEKLPYAHNFQVLEVRVPQHWFPFSRFDHAAHFGIPDINTKDSSWRKCSDIDEELNPELRAAVLGKCGPSLFYQIQPIENTRMDIQVIDAPTKQIIDGRTKCFFCHKNAQQSKKTEDLLLPGIELCRTCHVHPGGAQAECKTCHVFHPKTITKVSNSFLEGSMKYLSAIELK